ncbi:MAG: hypothetical protein KAV41_01085 [Candidatus Pacebacteria bacterium]|nr:hypothetical protein [Candidatus Paceibacterota bacterium]
MNFIQNLQDKSGDRKKTILFASVAILMVLVVVVWIFQMKNNFARRAETQTETKSQLPPISDIKDSVVDLYNESAEKIGDIKEGLKYINQ